MGRKGPIRQSRWKRDIPIPCAYPSQWKFCAEHVQRSRFLLYQRFRKNAIDQVVRALVYSLISALLLSLGWFPLGFSPLLFVAFVPLLLFEKELLERDFPDKATARSTGKIFLFSLLSFIVWNASVSWWVYFASPGGVVAAVVENALVMALVFSISHLIKKHIVPSFRFVVFPVVWLAYEYVNHN